MQTLQHLIAHATDLGGENLCADGHDWQSDGGRPCPTGNDECGQAVYRCARCGEYDYGTDPDGPGMTDCQAACGDSMTGWRLDWYELSEMTPNDGGKRDE